MNLRSVQWFNKSARACVDRIHNSVRQLHRYRYYRAIIHMSDYRRHRYDTIGGTDCVVFLKVHRCVNPSRIIENKLRMYNYTHQVVKDSINKYTQMMRIIDNHRQSASTLWK